MSDINQELLDELGIEVEAQPRAALTPKQERIIAGFEDIQNFFEEKGHLPSHGADKDIFERLYATRLEQIRRQSDCVELLKDYDHQNLLDGSDAEELERLDSLDADALLSELGIEIDAPAEDDITELKHVRSPAEIKAAEEIANRTVCEDFHLFKPVFTTFAEEISSGKRRIRPYKDDASVAQGNMFYLNGQRLYVAEKGKEYISHGRHRESQLRVIYDNGTESNLLMRSLQRALNKDENGRRVTDPEAGPLFTGEPDADDMASGTIYVCRSQSEDPFITENRAIIHKIGVTSTSLEKRFANAEHDPTFLMANVEVVATYELYNVNRTKLENLLHKFFSDAKLNVEITDRFGKKIKPKEWFMVSLDVIDEAIELLKSQKIIEHHYDVKEARIKKS